MRSDDVVGIEHSEIDVLLTAADVARTLQCSVRQVHCLARDKYIPGPIVIGGLKRWSSAEIRDFLQKGSGGI